mmetsp:Transcript_45919/g.146583  ORF Transcript_45919/g.146583 Transcript_45919/m.146583 type:complete len:361 (-) Transcript_45919:565-1647(-)
MREGAASPPGPSENSRGGTSAGGGVVSSLEAQSPRMSFKSDGSFAVGSAHLSQEIAKHARQGAAKMTGKMEATGRVEAFDLDGDGVLNEYEFQLARAAGMDLSLARDNIFKEHLKEVATFAHPTSLLLLVFVVVVWINFFKWVMHIAGVREGEWNREQHVELSVGAVAGWLHMAYYGRRFELFGHLLVMITKMVTRDISRFGLVYVAVLIAFAEAFTILVREEWYDENTGSSAGGYVSITASMMTLFRFSLGDINYDAYKDHKNIAWINSIFIIYAVMANIVLMNMLIAMMGNTYDAVSQNATRVWRLQWARIIVKIERRLSEKKKLHYRLGERHAGHYYRVHQEARPLREMAKERVGAA